MKEYTMYRCEICNTAYSEKKKAVDCEKSHKKIKEIKHCRYLSKAENGKGYPVAIDVLMENGEVITFKR